MDVIITRHGTTSTWSFPIMNFLTEAGRGPLWTLSPCPSRALYLSLLKSHFIYFCSYSTLSRAHTILQSFPSRRSSDLLVELRQIPTPCFLDIFQEFKCRSLRPGIISPVVGVRLTRLTHGHRNSAAKCDVQMVIPQDDFFVRVEPGPTLDTVAVSVRSLIPYPVEVRLKRFRLERNLDSSGYDKHEGLYREKIRFPCRIGTNSNPLFLRSFSRIQMSQSSSGHNISCCRSPIDAFDTWT